MLSGDMELFKDHEIAEMATNGLKRVFKFKSGPEFEKVYRFNPGIPKYFTGYSKYKNELFEKLARHPGLYLHSWFFHGIGMPACLEASFKLASGIEIDS